MNLEDFKTEHKEKQLRAVRLCMARNETATEIARILHITPKRARILMNEVRDQRADQEARKRKERNELKQEPGKVYYIRCGTAAGYWWQEGYWDRK